MTNPWGVRVEYASDHTGAQTSVTGTDQATYAHSMQYRAFGGLKSMAYGNGRSLSVSYDSRMRPTRWDTSGVIGSEYFYDYFNEHTGRVTLAEELYDSRLDRTYQYDQAGRLGVARTGAETLAATGRGPWGVQDGPYAHAYRYDSWGNITERIGWGGPNPSYTASYTNNRRDGLAYDLSGNFTAGGQARYDATGQQVSYAAAGMSHSYDGDRLRAARGEYGDTTYYVRSSVLGGQVVAEVKYFSGAWGWYRGFVYDRGGRLLSMREDGTVFWSHEDPVTKARKLTGTAGGVVSASVVDPWGGEVSGGWNFNATQQRRKFTTYERDSDGGDKAMPELTGMSHPGSTKPSPRPARTT